MRYFISQAMNGRTDAEIKEERHKVIAAMKKENPEAKVIDSFFEGVPNEARPEANSPPGVAKAMAEQWGGDVREET